MLLIQDIKIHFKEATLETSNLTEEDREKCKLGRLRSDTIDDFKQAIHDMRPAVEDDGMEESRKFRKVVEEMLGDAKDGILEK